ncbi:SREBP regulating gene protein-like [Xenia sp. Carnegie-2017]|uniref:SREBP regulating gene protein-like n=1 Tax=Xenia sp. Carnegie-2017 TaxID=2897299 RepID=UPI001F03344B|nr:SREBP regulating gene protein-like [Xenia sp. Carnegie-2017]
MVNNCKLTVLISNDLLSHEMRLYYKWLFVIVIVLFFVIIWRNYSTDYQDETSSLKENDETPTFQWVEFKSHRKCRNSVQGYKLIVDDLGYICEWSDRLSNGCCFPKGPSTNQFVCNSCLVNHCCSVYEHCVSCCLHPNKKLLLRSILANNSRKILKMVTDQFEFCIVKCRTSSQSVVHENHYRNSKHKHCFGFKLPEAEPL